MARGLVRMERESGFCIWEQRQKDTAVPNSESIGSQRSTSFKSEQQLTQSFASRPAARANLRVWFLLQVSRLQGSSTEILTEFRSNFLSELGESD